MSNWTWKMDAETAGISALIMGDAAAFLSGTCPSLFTMRTFRSSKNVTESANTKVDIRIGSAVGGALAIVVGLGGSAVTQSWWPVTAAIVALVVLIAAYEWALANPHNQRDNIKDQ